MRVASLDFRFISFSFAYLTIITGKRRIIGEKQLLRLQGPECRTSSSRRSPLKIANSLAHQGLCFSSPGHQAQKEHLSPVKRRRSSSADLLLIDGREIAPAAIASMSEGEDMHLRDNIPDKVTFWEGNKLSIATNDQAVKPDYGLCRDQKTVLHVEDTPPVTQQLTNDATPLKSENGKECQALQFEEADYETVIHTEDNIRESATDELDRDKTSDEVTMANSNSKPKTDMHLVLDTALLRDFLDRAAASKERKREDIAKQSSILHRRDSDAVRNALGSGSPTTALGERDPLSPPQSMKSRSRSPDKDNSSPAKSSDLFDDGYKPEPLLSEVTVPTKMRAPSSPKKTSRRSSRVRNSRVLQQNSEVPVNTEDDHSRNETQIAQSVKSKDKTPAKKTEAQELAQLTRKNSNKNKRGALPVSLRLADLAKGEEYTSGHQAKGESQAGAHKDTHSKTVTWAENLVQYSTSNEQVCIVLKKVSYSTPKKGHNRATPDTAASSFLGDTSKLRSTKSENIKTPAIADEDGSQTPSRGALPLRKSGTSTPRARRVRGLGTSNGTPAKGLLASSLLPPEIRETKETSTSIMEKTESIDKRKLAAAKRGKQENLKGTAATADRLENRHVSKLVPPKITGLAGLGIGKVIVPTPKSSRRK